MYEQTYLHKFLLFLFIFSLRSSLMSTPFSFELPCEVTDFVTQQPSFITANDHTKLAYYHFMPEQPDAIIIFYHGAGIWSNNLYQYLAKELSDNNIGVYLFDIRGHGNSQGERGDTPSAPQIFSDISSAINFVSEQHKNVPIFLAGHSAGAGLVLNYNNQPTHKKVTGYILLAPLLGSNQHNVAYEHSDIEKRFIKKLRLFPLIVNAMSNGWFCAHTPALFFNYPECEKKKDSHILDYYTSAMAQAVTPPDSPQKTFGTINTPCCVLIGEQDEQFIPKKIMECKAYMPQSAQLQSIFYTIPEATHLSVVLRASDIIPQWIQSLKK